MEWPKVKNIIILILLLVNGFLLALVGVQQYQVRRYQNSALAQTLTVLERAGITVDPHVLEDAPAAALTAGRDVEAMTALAGGVLGGEPVLQERGGLYSCTGEAGTVVFRSAGAVAVTLWDTHAPDGDLAAHGEAVLREMGIEGELWKTAETEGGTRLTFRQLWEGNPLFSCTATFEYMGQQLLTINGSLLLTSDLQTGDSLRTMELPTALIRFREGIAESGDVCSALLAFRGGYRSVSAFGSSVTLSPAWYVTTNTAEYYLDAVTGELSRVT